MFSLPFGVDRIAGRHVSAALLFFGLVLASGAASAGNPVKLVPGQPVSQPTSQPVTSQPAATTINDAAAPKAIEVQQVPAARAPRPLISPKLAPQPAKPKQLMTLPSGVKPVAPAVNTEPATTVVEIPAEPKAQPEPQQLTGDVVVGQLTKLDPSSVGLLDPATGGFGPQMWRGSDRKRVETLLPRLPMGSLSATMQFLARRLLLSAAAVPEGEAVAPSLLGLRVERLAAGGLTNETNQLLHMVPARLSDPAFTQAEMQGYLLSGDRASFCVRIEGLVAEDPNPYWLKGLAFCKALEGEAEAVDLAVSILQDQGVTGDDAFFSLARALTGDEDAQVQSLIDPTPLQLAMLRAAQQPLPADAVPGASPGILRAEATMANADIEIRLAAAEKAETAGALSTELLSQIYAGIQFSEEELQDWQTRIDSMKGARLNALLFQVATVETDVQTRVKVLRSAWRWARQEGGFGTMARVTHDLARVIEPADDLIWAAVDVARSLLMAGDVASARRWFDYVRQLALLPKEEPTPIVATAPEATPVPAADTSATLPKLMATNLGSTTAPVIAAPPRPKELAAKAVLELWPLMQLSDTTGELGWNPAAAAAWAPSQRAVLGETVATERATMLFILLDALGYALPDSTWDSLLQGSLTVTAYVPSTALVRSLEGAALDKRLGETVLLGLLALGDVGPAGADPSTLRVVMRAFNSVGLKAESRALALEAVLGRGF